MQNDNAIVKELDLDTTGDGKLVTPAEETNVFKAAWENSKLVAKRLADSVKARLVTGVFTRKLEGHRHCELTPEQVAEDQRIRNDVIRFIKPTMEALEVRRSEYQRAKENYQNAVTIREQETRKKDLDYCERLLNQSIRSTNEYNRLKRQNPRAFGLAWVTPAERQKNAFATSEIRGLTEQLEIAKAKIVPPYGPVEGYTEI